MDDHRRLGFILRRFILDRGVVLREPDYLAAFAARKSEQRGAAAVIRLHQPRQHSGGHFAQWHKKALIAALPRQRSDEVLDPQLVAAYSTPQQHRASIRDNRPVLPGVHGCVTTPMPTCATAAAAALPPHGAAAHGLLCAAR